MILSWRHTRVLENTVREISTVSVCLFVKSFWNVIAEEWPFDNSSSARDWLVNIPGIFYSSFNFILFRKNRLLLSEVKATKPRLNKNQYCENSDHHSGGGESQQSCKMVGEWWCGYCGYDVRVLHLDTSPHPPPSPRGRGGQVRQPGGPAQGTGGGAAGAELDNFDTDVHQYSIYYIVLRPLLKVPKLL